MGISIDPIAGAQAEVQSNQVRFETSTERNQRVNGFRLRQRKTYRSIYTQQPSVKEPYSACCCCTQIIPLCVCAAPIKCREIVVSSMALTGDYETTKEPSIGCFTPPAECINVSNHVRTWYEMGSGNFIRWQESLLLYGCSTFETRSHITFAYLVRTWTSFTHNLVGKWKKNI